MSMAPPPPPVPLFDHSISNTPSDRSTPMNHHNHTLTSDSMLSHRILITPSSLKPALITTTTFSASPESVSPQSSSPPSKPSLISASTPNYPLSFDTSYSSTPIEPPPPLVTPNPSTTTIPHHGRLSSLSNPPPRRTRSRRATSESISYSISHSYSPVRSQSGLTLVRAAVTRTESSLSTTTTSAIPAASSHPSDPSLVQPIHNQPPQLTSLPPTTSPPIIVPSSDNTNVPVPIHTLPKRTTSIVRRHAVNASVDTISDTGPNSILQLTTNNSIPSSSTVLPQFSQQPPSQPTPFTPNSTAPIISTTNTPVPGSPTDLNRRRTISRNIGANKIDKNHEKYAFMYHMLTGIRLSVSRCEAKDDRDLLPDDFNAQHKLTSDVTGAELEPSQRYDFKFKDYCPLVFRKIRAAFGLTAPDYLNSLTGKYILSELFSPGKSKSYLYYSHDYRYIIKTIHPAEQKRLLKILPQYVEYVTKNPNTLLARYYGLHRVKMPKRDPVHFVVMANVFPPNYDIHLTFDLKGSTVGREISPEELARKGKKAVLKDLNWLNMNRKLMLGPEKARLFCDQLERDMLFLMSKNIMDYSLLVGIHDLSKGNVYTSTPQTSNDPSGVPGGAPITLSSNNPNNVGGVPLGTVMPSTTSNSNPPTNIPALQVFEPNRMMTLQRPLGGILGGGQTTRADTVRRALQQPEITRLDTISALHLEPDEPHRSRSVFFADMGGFRATDMLNRPLNELYFMSIIDILTPYNTSKKVEHAFKLVTRPTERHNISAVKPSEYGRRFVNFMKNLVGTVQPPIMTTTTTTTNTTVMTFHPSSSLPPPISQPTTTTTTTTATTTSSPLVPISTSTSSNVIGGGGGHVLAIVPRTEPIGEEKESDDAINKE